MDEMQKQILQVLEDRQGLTYRQLRSCFIAEPDVGNFRAERPLVHALAELHRRSAVVRLEGGIYVLNSRPPREPLSARLRRFLLSAPGIPRPGARRSQKTGNSE